MGSIRLGLARFLAAQFLTLFAATSALAAPVEEIYVLCAPFGAPGRLGRVTPGSGQAMPGFMTIGATPNEIDIVGRKAYVVSSQSNALLVADLTSGTLVDEISLAPEQNPWNVEVVRDRAYVSNLLTNSVSVVDLTVGAAMKTIAVGKSPEGLLVDGGRLYVANSGFDFTTFSYDPGTVSVIDLGMGVVIDVVETGLNPQALARDAKGRIHVVCTGNYFDVPGEVNVIDPASHSVTGVVPIGGAPGTITIAEDGRGYLGSYFDGVLVYDAASGVPIRDATNPVDVGGPGAGGVLGARGGGAWVAVSDASDLLVRLDAGLDIAAAYALDDSPLSLARSIAFSPAPGSTAFSNDARGGEALSLAQLGSSRGTLRARIALGAPQPDVRLALYDVTGRALATRDLGALATGPTEIAWEFTREAVASGRYFLRAAAGGGSATLPVVLVR
ncbi:MAG: hypothetical protein ACKVU1_06710 [bacterium]